MRVQITKFKLKPFNVFNIYFILFANMYLV